MRAQMKIGEKCHSCERGKEKDQVAKGFLTMRGRRKCVAKYLFRKSQHYEETGKCVCRKKFTAVKEI